MKCVLLTQKVPGQLWSVGQIGNLTNCKQSPGEHHEKIAKKAPGNVWSGEQYNKT